jgi:signal transduction histidine kinase
MQQKKIMFSYSKEDTVPQYVASDEQRLKQILVNLLVNATKFTDQGSIQLRVSLFPASSLKKTKSLFLEEFKTLKQKMRRSPFQETTHCKLNEYLRFDIIDTGVGITPDQIQKLFRPHSQVHRHHQHLVRGIQNAITNTITWSLFSSCSYQSRMHQLELDSVSSFARSS